MSPVVETRTHRASPCANGLREFGDFQTPLAFAAEVVAWLRARGLRFGHVFEPTCGSGAFIRAVRAAYGDTVSVAGLELRDGYRGALAPLADERTAIAYGDAAALDLRPFLRGVRPGTETLVIGNLPWVTTDGLTRMRVAASPARTNPKELRGFAARTGPASFDVAEYLALRLFDAIASACPAGAAFAMLLKESVARRLLLELRRRATPVGEAAVVRIDAKAVFGAAVDACLLMVRFSPGGQAVRTVAVARSLAEPPSQTWYVGDSVVAADAAVAAGLASGLVWRQGIKHDAAAVFELTRTEHGFVNGLGEPADAEPETVFPLVRSGRLARGEGHDGAAFLLVPYRGIGRDEQELSARAPRLFRYLLRHAAAVDARRSSIYRNAPRFAIFGVGPYSFARHKVAISGLHREPRFVVLSGETPVQLGDTAYSLSFASRADAVAVAALLSAQPLLQGLRSAIFAGKRPVTKRLLAQLDPRPLVDRPDVVASVRAALAAAGEDALAPEPVARRLRELLTGHATERFECVAGSNGSGGIERVS